MKQLTAAGVYIFAGGFTLGVKRAGFKVIAQLEDGPYGVATTRLNHPDVQVFSDRGAWPIDELAAARPDFVYGNPPCAVFSAAGFTRRVKQQEMKWRTDPRTSCVARMLDIFERVRPTVWAYESVQFAATRGRDLMWEIMRTGLRAGYAASAVFVNGAHLGLPQRRRRLFMVLHKVALDWSTYDRNARQVTVSEALAGLEDPERATARISPHYFDILEHTKPGENMTVGFARMHELAGTTPELNARGQVRGRPAFVYVRLKADAVSSTLLGGPRYFHPTESRLMTVKEFQVLNGYPPDYRFVTRGIDEQYQQAAQCVTPTVGEWLARVVRVGLERAQPVDAVPRTVDLERGNEVVLNDGDPLR